LGCFALFMEIEYQPLESTDFAEYLSHHRHLGAHCLLVICDFSE